MISILFLISLSIIVFETDMKNNLIIYYFQYKDLTTPNNYKNKTKVENIQL